MDISHSAEEVQDANFTEDLYSKYIEDVLLNKLSVPVAIISVYILFCTWIGPALMRNRQPFRMTGLIVIYDVCLVFLNLYLAIQLGKYCLGLGWDFHCPKDISSLKKYGFKGMNKNKYALLLYASKYVDLFDTVFFVLSKKHGHISFLHIFHHASMPLIYRFGMLIHSEGTVWFCPCMINCSIHVVMYSYYAIIAIGLKSLSRLKRYLTMVQMVQFLVVQAYVSWLRYEGCMNNVYTYWLSWAFLMALFVLFLNFYHHNFVKKKTS